MHFHTNISSIIINQKKSIANNRSTTFFQIEVFFVGFFISSLIHTNSKLFDVVIVVVVCGSSLIVQKYCVKSGDMGGVH